MLSFAAELRADAIPLENPTIALYRDFISMTSFQSYTNCEVLATPEKYRFTPCGFAMQKNSPYLDLFNYYLIEMRDKGMSNKILSKYEPRAQACPDSSGLPIGFNNCFTAFLFLIGGMITGLVLFIIECVSLKAFKSHIGILECYDKYIFHKDDCCENCQVMILEKEAQQEELEELRRQNAALKSEVQTAKQVMTNPTSNKFPNFH